MLKYDSLNQQGSANERIQRYQECVIAKFFIKTKGNQEKNTKATEKNIIFYK